MSSNPNRRLYLARFEIVNWGADFQYPEAVLQSAQQKGTVGGWIDFLCGFPMACVELLAMVGEVSSIPDLKVGLDGNSEVEEVPGDGGYTPAFPKTLFGGYATNKMPVNLMWLDGDYSESMPPDLTSQFDPQPKGLHWWTRVALMSVLNSDTEGQGQHFPYPGEFLALACRIFVDRFVGFDSQESNPFLFAGNFMDTVYLTSGFVTAVSTPTAEFPYPQYSVMWRKDPSNSSDTGIVLNVLPTDFAEYKGPQGSGAVGDRVTILKDVTTTKTSQLWKDKDMSPPLDVTKNMIAPLMFYSINPEAATTPD
jgi:hypothetical protein